MKKVLCLILTICMIIGLSACGNTNEKNYKSLLDAIAEKGVAVYDEDDVNHPDRAIGYYYDYIVEDNGHMLPLTLSFKTEEGTYDSSTKISIKYYANALAWCDSVNYYDSVYTDAYIDSTVMWNLNDELFSYTWDLNMEISPQFLNFYKINGLIGKNATTITEAYGGYYKMSVKDFSDNIELPDISLDVIDSKLDKFAVKDKVSEDLFTAMRCFDAAVNELCNFGISQLGFKAYK